MNAQNVRIALIGFIGLSLAAVVSFPLTAGAQENKLPKLVETVVVDAGEEGGSWSSQALTEGLTYELRVAGTFTYGQGDSKADAECSQLLPDETWSRNRYAAMTGYRDVLDLYLDQDAVDWEPTDADAFGCNSFNNTYIHRFTMPETRHIRLFIRDIDGSYYENAGGVSVKIREVDPQAEAVEPVGNASVASAPSSSVAKPAPTVAPAAPASVAPVAPAPVEPVEHAAAAPAAPLPGELLIKEQALGVDGTGDPLAPATSVRHELLAVLGLAAWLAVVAMIIRRFQFVVVPAGTTFYAGPPPSA